MFDVGDEVVCIDDGPFNYTKDGVSSVHDVPFKKGESFVVVEVYVKGSVHFRGPDIMRCGCDNIGIGRPDFDGWDVWPDFRFRKVIKLDTKESLSELINIANTAPAKPETVDA